MRVIIAHIVATLMVIGIILFPTQLASASRDNVSESRRLPSKCTIDEIMKGKYDGYITDLVMDVNSKYDKETLTFSSSLFKTEKRKTP